MYTYRAYTSLSLLLALTRALPLIVSHSVILQKLNISVLDFVQMFQQHYFQEPPGPQDDQSSRLAPQPGTKTCFGITEREIY